MILKSTGIIIGNYFIPPFEVREGELVVLYLYGGAHYHHLKSELVKILTGKRHHPGVKISSRCTFAEHVAVPAIRRWFFPVTVGGYIKRHAALSPQYSSLIYQREGITPKTRVRDLSITERKILSIYAALSRTNNIIFDFVGQGPTSAEETMQIVRESISSGSSAILLDWADDMKEEATTFITLECLS